MTPAPEGVRGRYGAEEGLAVGVVPVRESEAWALVDGDALRRALGADLADDELRIPASASRVEKLPEPKKDFEHACVGNRRSRGPKPTVYLPLLGETVCLEKLGRLPAFKRLHNDLTETLRQLRIIPGAADD